MDPRDTEKSAELEQLELIQRLGRIGYWEYNPAEHSFTMPPYSLELLSSLIGTTPEALPNLREVMPDAERRRFLNALEQAVKGQLALHLQLQLIAYRGQQATIVVKGIPVKRPSGYRFAGTFHDITYEKRVEIEREEVLSQLQAVINGLPVGITVFDEDLRLLFWNARIYDILGLPQRAVYKFVRFEDLIRYPAERGEYGPGDPAELVAQRADLARKFEAHRFERAASNGRTLLVEGYPFHFGDRVAGFVTTYTDITEQKKNAEQISHQNQVLKAIIDHFPGGVSLFDANLRLVASNGLLQRLLDFPDWLLKRDTVFFEDLARFNILRGEYGNGDPKDILAELMARARNPQPHRVERTRPNGQVLEIIGAPIPDGGFVTIYMDITERKRAEARILNMALRDPLTRLPNRIHLNDLIEQALIRSAEHQEAFALLFLDLDGFKQINDSYGHDAGDQLLIEVAGRLRQAVRETDTVARLGGDEFIVLLRDIADSAAAEEIAAGIIKSVAEPLALHNVEALTGTSIGIALHPVHGKSREALLKAADEAMYRAKAAGRGTWRMACLAGE